MDVSVGSAPSVVSKSGMKIVSKCCFLMVCVSAVLGFLSLLPKHTRQKQHEGMQNLHLDIFWHFVDEQMILAE